MVGQEGESEFEEVERQLGGGTAAATNGKPPARNGSKGALNGAGAGGGADKAKWGAGLRGVLPPVLLEAFVLTFLAEWGDRSQVEVFIQACHMCSVSMWFLLLGAGLVSSAPSPSACTTWQ